MYKALLFTGVMLLGCSGSLSDEQRKELREAQSQQVIVKVSEADLLAAAFEQGRKVSRLLNNEGAEPSQLDSIAASNHVQIRWRVLNPSDALEIERQVIEAYLAAASAGAALADNVQRVGSDSLLYTLPVTRYRPDSVLEVAGVWSIKMATKHIVLGIQAGKSAR